MQAILRYHFRLGDVLESRWFEGGALLLARLALAGVFWRSGRSKVVEGSWFEMNETTRFLFENEYAGVPLPPDVAAQIAIWGEHVFPLLLGVGLLTRLSALGLLGMTLVIQIFVYPEAWWTTHSLWAALALALASRGAGRFSADAVLQRLVR